MNLKAILPLLVASIGITTADETREAFEQNVKYEKKPPQPYEFINYHQFQSTPFTDNNTYNTFLDSPIDESSALTYKEITELNSQIRPDIFDLVNQNFFRIFRLNLFTECPFWRGKGFCMHQTCAVDTIDDWDELPDIWQPEALGKLEDSNLVTDINKKITGETQMENDTEYCQIDGINDETVYVDLVANPERFTGYGGDQSWQIWKSIYNENCFNLGHDQCVEKNFFYKLVSGMHASISTHLSNEYLDKSKKEYLPNLEQFMFRVGDFPERIQNIYLNYIIVLKALIKLDTSGVLDDLQFCSDEYNLEKNSQLKDNLKNILNKAIDINKEKESCMFDENILFQDEDSAMVKTEIRQNFRNITRIMDCVHCDRCRLWGKVQTTGYGTALKILFELNSTNSTSVELDKIELIALVNTFDRLSKSIQSIQKFKELYDEAIWKEESGTQSDDEGMNGTFNDMFSSSSFKKSKEENSLIAEKQKIDTPTLFSSDDDGDVYDDIIYLTTSQEDGQSISAIFWIELGNVWEAVKFVVNSYLLFPKIVYNWCLIRVMYYWNVFVGQIHAEYDTDKFYRVEL
ncbi:ER oxidoreductin [Martiniozyma asiatica (nom. inval.)]|nr:ER oxidoreductin [Martiniozyma asiatica]